MAGKNKKLWGGRFEASLSPDAVELSYTLNEDMRLVIYDIHVGSNLISYPYLASQAIDDGFGEASLNIYGLLGEGAAAINIENSWLGTLVALEGSKGYWLVALEDFTFFFRQFKFMLNVAISGSVSVSPNDLIIIVLNLSFL